jgi:hypothetical protein
MDNPWKGTTLVERLKAVLLVEELWPSELRADDLVALGEDLLLVLRHHEEEVGWGV